MNITLKDLVPHREMQFQPVEDDDDDLSKAIQDDAARQDDSWQLTDDLDGTELAAFWDDALKELGPDEVEQD